MSKEVPTAYTYKWKVKSVTGSAWINPKDKIVNTGFTNTDYVISDSDLQALSKNSSL